jgi:hypothetical protein
MKPDGLGQPQAGRRGRAITLGCALRARNVEAEEHDLGAL